MRNFNTRFRLRDTDRQIRLVYTWFLLLMLMGFVFTFVWAHSMTDLTPKGIAQHYRGSDDNFGEPMSFGQLAETSHFHLFTMPVVFLIMVHVLYLTMASPLVKVLTTWAAFRGRDVGSRVAVADHLRIPPLRGDIIGRRRSHDDRIFGHVCDSHV